MFTTRLQSSQSGDMADRIAFLKAQMAAIQAELDQAGQQQSEHEDESQLQSQMHRSSSLESATLTANPNSLRYVLRTLPKLPH